MRYAVFNGSAMRIPTDQEAMIAQNHDLAIAELAARA
jgi:hypothetical protein